ncbi:MAG TPA: sigma 54-interacting transcriptional regulator [Bryobacteraceae bacterium]|nr:sigma 54-interacting transcriptional regulator [Bryobacteraceae bacterium]
MDSQFAERYQMLIRVSQAIKSHRDSNELFRALTTELHKVVAFDGIYCTHYDEVANKVQWRWSETSSGVRLPDFPPQETMTLWVYQHQQPLVIHNLDQETRFPRLVEFLKGQGIQSTCALPLTTGRRKLGSFGFCSTKPGAYSEDEVRFLSVVVDQVALAVDDALNSEELEKKNRQLSLLLELNNAVVSTLELRDLLRAMAASVRKIMKSDGVGVALPDQENNHLKIYALDLPSTRTSTREGITISLDQSIAPVRVFRTGRPEVVSRSPDDFSLCDMPENAIADGICSMCFLPLVTRNRTLGILTLARCERDAFTQDEVDFLMQAANQLAIAVENALGFREIAELKDKLAREKVYLEDEIRGEMSFDEIVGRSPALRNLLQQVEVVAPTDSTVLIYGETGSGKELIARAIHDLSARRQNAFVKLNCAAIPTGLLESELFGHEKGAFTGAVAQRIGRFEVADRGTMFLDEIGEVPLELQPKLLRVLQEREFERLGSSRTIRTDARLVAATNQDLAAMVKEQKFRSDLFYRLDVFPLHVPPLRERRDDIPLLVRHFVQQYARRMNRAIDTIPSEAMSALVQYHWPGNIRELQNLVERAVILSPGPVLNVPLSGLQSRVEPSKKIDTLEDAERRHIMDALHATNWVVGGPRGAAKLLGMKRTTLQWRMDKLGIQVRTHRSADA